MTVCRHAGIATCTLAATRRCSSGRGSFYVSPTEIAERTPISESRIVLSSVQKLIVDGSRAYIYISPVQAFVVPETAFADAATMDGFVAALENATGIPALRDRSSQGTSR